MISRLVFLCLFGSTIMVHCISNFLLVRPADQQWRQLEVRFYSMCYIMWSRSGVLPQYKSEKLNQTLYEVNQVLPQKIGNSGIY